MEDRLDLMDGLERMPRILSAFVAGISDDKLNRRRGDGFWTIAEHVSHLAQVQPMLLDRLHRFRDEGHPEFVPYIPGGDEDEPDTPEVLAMATALAQFADSRRQQIDLLEGLDEQTWRRTATHPEYDSYSLYILVRHILMHDHWHMYRVEELWLTKDPFLTRMD